MSLSKGDHLRIQRNGRLVEPEEEAYHKFEVLGSIGSVSHELLNHVAHEVGHDEDGNPYTYHDVRIRVIK